MTRDEGHLGIGDRLAEGPAPELIRSAFALETSYGPLLYHGMSLADLAHTVMLIEAKIVSPQIGARLLGALLELHAIPAHEFPFDPGRGDAYTNREYALRQRATDAADWLQAGRARRESSTVGYALVVRAGLLDVVEALLGALRALLDRAAEHMDTLMPDYTYLQTAQPTTLAHYLLTFAQPITRDLARLRAAFDNANRSPAGIGSTNGSRLPLDRARLAALLGFQGLTLHTRDAMWQPDAPIEVAAALTAMLINADRLAEDLQIWATAEFDYVEPADRHSRVSVIMPQKKNPYGLAFVRGAARDMIGKLASTAALQATPSGQVDNRIFIYGAIPQALAQAALALRLLAAIVADLAVHTDALRERAWQEHSGATDLAEAIMLSCGLSPRAAHRIVGRAVRLAQSAGHTIDAGLLDAAALEVIKRPLSLSDRFIADRLDPRQIVDSRTTTGGAAAQAVRPMIAAFSAIAVGYHDWLKEQQGRLAAAEQVLIEQAEILCQSI
ncbi:MAG: lyase family protein [Roseiflexaceae bacterium]